MAAQMTLTDYTVLAAKIVCGFRDPDFSKCVHCYGAGRSGNQLIQHGRKVLEALEHTFLPLRLRHFMQKRDMVIPGSFRSVAFPLMLFSKALSDVVTIAPADEKLPDAR